MAAVGCSLAGSGPQSPLNRNLERSFDEAQVSGELKIGSRRLREFPKIAAKYQLDDTVYAGNDRLMGNFPTIPFPCNNCLTWKPGLEGWGLPARVVARSGLLACST